MTDDKQPIAIDIDDLPELDTLVGLVGSAHREEVGGALCFAIAMGSGLSDQ